MTQSPPKGTVEELKECPFCGGTASSDNYCRDGRQVNCTICNASVRCYEPNASSKSIAAWNTRVTAIDSKTSTQDNVLDVISRLLQDVDEHGVIDKTDNYDRIFSYINTRTPPAISPDSRERFERVMSGPAYGYGMRRKDGGNWYANADTLSAWFGWQAALSSKGDV